MIVILTPVWHLFLRFTGATSAIWGTEWGGFLGDLGIFGFVWSLLRSKNCEVKGCPRLGRHATAANHKVCRKHHPDDHLTAQHVVDAHNAVLKAD